MLVNKKQTELNWIQRRKKITEKERNKQKQPTMNMTKEEPKKEQKRDEKNAQMPNNINCWTKNLLLLFEFAFVFCEWIRILNVNRVYIMQPYA